MSDRWREPRRLACCATGCNPYSAQMRMFFRTWKEIRIVLDNLAAMQCPFCGTSGCLVRHGFIRGFVSHDRRGIRARRVRCKKSPRRKGCSRSFSLRIAGTLPRRCFSAKGLWAFIQQLRQGKSIKAAWENSPIRMSLDTGYRLYKRLQLCQPILRSQLCCRSPPPSEKKSAGAPLLQVFDHLRKAFDGDCPVSAYQECFQKDFLAIA